MEREGGSESGEERERDGERLREEEKYLKRETGVE